MTGTRTMTTLLSGLGVGESPRWHDGRLWFANWGAQEIVAADLAGRAEVIAKGPKLAGYSLGWLPDGRLVVTGESGLLCAGADGTLTPYADLSALGEGWNEIVVDGRGNIYVNRVGFRFGEEDFKPGTIALVNPDGTARQVAADIAFPNGMVVTPDGSTLVVAESFAGRLTAFDIADDGSLSGRRVWAEVGGDGLCLDAEGAIWCADMTDGGAVCRRVRDGGEVLEQFELDAPCFACMLGGDDGRTLFLMLADWQGVEGMDTLFSSRTGRVVTTRVSVPHAGRP
ncbi:SMP-30/gluconolactonase/LRE family protein [Prauserella muralis]|uniref:Gluconolaconase n=1 Tax=Prauserella muralis TaxID=588067 RepID=A0A2V4B1N0_9PSEU|nr:SMP-30/gluconolactonase/LRE family protein [Prauserella muralis]PXY27288.1 gluconolaconase [Prauserella muralis]TWE23041.1 sugar lactone lactonase YvrE [Prauserella muralis]